MNYFRTLKKRLYLRFLIWFHGYLLGCYFESVGANIERFVLICQISDFIKILESEVKK